VTDSKRLPRHDEDRHPPRQAAVAQLDDVAVLEPVLLGEPRAHPGRRIPRELRHRLRQLLEPAVVGKAAVPDGRIRPEDDFEAPLGGRLNACGRDVRFGRERLRWRDGRLRCRASCGRRRLGGCHRSCSGGAGGRAARRRRLRARREGCGGAAVGHGRAGDEPVVHDPAPEGLRVAEGFPVDAPDVPAAAIVGARPVVLDDVVRAAVGLGGEDAEHLVGRAPLVERRDERLRERHRAVERAGVPPALERVRRRDVPVRQVRGFVHVGAVVGDEGDPREALGKPEIDRRGEHRVAAEDHEQLDLPGVHRSDQLVERGRLVGRLRLDGGAVGDRRADVAERLVHRVGQRVDRRRLVLAGDDGRPAAVRLEIARHRSDPLGHARGVGPRHARTLARGGAADRRRQLAREAFDLARAQRQAVIRLRAGQRRAALDDIQAVHLLVVVGHPPAGREVLLVAHVAGPARQEVGVERHDHIGLVEVADRRPLGAGLLCAEARAVAGHRVPLVPAGLGVLSQHVGHLLGERWGGHRAGEKTHACAPPRLLGAAGRLHRREEVAPRPDLAAVGDDLRAIGVVETEHRCLRDRVGRPQAGRVVRVALDLRGPAHVAFDQDGLRDAAERDCAREEQRAAGDDVLGLADVGDDRLERLPGAGAHAGQRERCAHQLEELAPALRVVPLRGLLGELAVQVFAELGGVGQFAETAPVEAPLGAGQA
jgi:hypothetical protein